MILFGTKNWKIELIFPRENPSHVYANEQSFVSEYTNSSRSWFSIVFGLMNINEFDKHIYMIKVLYINPWKNYFKNVSVFSFRSNIMY